MTKNPHQNWPTSKFSKPTLALLHSFAALHLIRMLLNNHDCHISHGWRARAGLNNDSSPRLLCSVSLIIMGRLIHQLPNEDPARLSRVLDAKYRCIGVCFASFSVHDALSVHLACLCVAERTAFQFILCAGGREYVEATGIREESWRGCREAARFVRSLRYETSRYQILQACANILTCTLGV